MKRARMIRRLFRSGHSVVLSLPREILDELGIKVGDKIELKLDRSIRRVILTPANPAVAGVDEKFA
jgi:antitoxin MazE